MSVREVADATGRAGRSTKRITLPMRKAGTLIAEDREHLEGALESTAKALKGGAAILYEPAFLAHDVLVRPDILVRSQSGSWDLIEVKSSTEVKKEHVQDVAVQRFVIEGYGLPLRQTLLMHINNRYVRDGDIDPGQLFVKADITVDVAQHVQDVPANVKSFLATAASEREPAIDIGHHCSDPYDCEFTPYCWQHVPEYSIFDIARISAKKIAILREAGVMDIKDVPDAFDLTENQRVQLDVAKSGKDLFQREAVANLLEHLTHPLHFLDFESFNPAVPLYDGTRPYQQIPFQASVHVQRHEDGPVEHMEYIGDGKNDPRPGLVSFLVNSIGSNGSIVVFHANFEGDRLKELAADFIREASQLLSMKDRLWDLEEPFRRNLYVHPGFRGRSSTKVVLPTLVPEMTYEGMPIAEGRDATIGYLAIMSGNLSADESKRTIGDLKSYCCHDTFGMVQLLMHCRSRLNLPVVKKSPEDPMMTQILERANAGDAAAQYVLGSRYAQGRGVPKDDAQAVHWFRQAAKQGYVDATKEIELLTMPLNEFAKAGRDLVTHEIDALRRAVNELPKTGVDPRSSFRGSLPRACRPPCTGRSLAGMKRHSRVFTCPRQKRDR